jgi:hypothetical protein
MDRKPQQRIKCIYLAAFSRPPAAKEVESALSFINALNKEIRSEKSNEDKESENMAWDRFCQSLLISNEFLFRN